MADADQPAPIKAPPRYSLPTATGVPHTCLQYYPSLAKRLGIQGQTTIRFTIKEDGAVRDGAVTVSSGNDLLDQATIDCSSGWTYKPATRDGAAIAVPWTVRVEWYLHNTYEGPAQDEIPPPGAHWTPPIPRPGEDHGCAISFNNNNVLIPIKEPIDPTVVLFTITPEGSTRDFVVSRSSGSPTHDDFAIGCVKDWHYLPANHGGVPATAHWSATIPWPDTGNGPSLGK